MGLKSAWHWFVGNVRSTNPVEPVQIGLERNREAAVEMGAHNPPGVPLYRFRLGLRAGFSGDAEACIPVFRRDNPHPHPVLKEIFYCEVAGSTLEAANVHALLDKVGRMLETLAPAQSLPLAYFTVPSMDYRVPVYEEGGRLVCPVLAGPKLKAAELATVRQHVYRYLLNAGYVTDEADVELEVVRPSDLRLVPPAAVISSLEDPSVWHVTVEGRSSEGIVIGLLGEATELRKRERERAGAPPAGPPPAATDIASLLRLVGNELLEAERIADPFAIYARQVRPEIWARTEELTDDVGHRLVCWLEDAEGPARLELPLRRTAAGELLTALEDQGICVFAAAEEPTLAQKVGRYLSGQGFLRFQDTVEVVGPEAPAASEPAGLVAGGEIEFPRLEFGSPREAAPDESKDLERKQTEEVGHP